LQANLIFKMERKEFLKQLWTRIYKSLLIIAAVAILYMVLKFIIEITGDNDSGTFWVDIFFQTISTIGIIAGIFILLGVLHLVRNYIEIMGMRIFSRLPDAVRLRLRVAKRTFVMVCTLAAGAGFYLLFTKDPVTATIFLFITLAQVTMDIFAKEKQKDKNRLD